MRYEFFHFFLNELIFPQTFDGLMLDRALPVICVYDPVPCDSGWIDVQPDKTVPLFIRQRVRVSGFVTQAQLFQPFHLDGRESAFAVATGRNKPSVEGLGLLSGLVKHPCSRH